MRNGIILLHQIQIQLQLHAKRGSERAIEKSASWESGIVDVHTHRHELKHRGIYIHDLARLPLFSVTYITIYDNRALGQFLLHSEFLVSTNKGTLLVHTLMTHCQQQQAQAS